MGQYTEQANKYSNNANKINELLNEALIESKKIEEILQIQNSNLDYLQDKIVNGNEEIKKRIGKIQDKLNSNSSALQKKGKAIDDQIEKLRKEKDKNITIKKDNNESGMTSRTMTRKDEINGVSRILN